MSTHYLWLFYLIGALLTLVFKWVRWCVTGSHVYQRTWKTSTHEWFDLRLMADKASWITTLGVVWVFGTVYINRIPFLWEWISNIPLHYSIAFLLGSLMEFIAPAAVKWILGKIPESILP